MKELQVSMEFMFRSLPTVLHTAGPIHTRAYIIKYAQDHLGKLHISQLVLLAGLMKVQWLQVHTASAAAFEDSPKALLDAGPLDVEGAARRKRIRFT